MGEMRGGIGCGKSGLDEDVKGAHLDVDQRLAKVRIGRYGKGEGRRENWLTIESPKIIEIQKKTF